MRVVYRDSAWDPKMPLEAISRNLIIIETRRWALLTQNSVKRHLGPPDLSRHQIIIEMWG